MAGGRSAEVVRAMLDRASAAAEGRADKVLPSLSPAATARRIRRLECLLRSIVLSRGDGRELARLLRELDRE